MKCIKLLIVWFACLISVTNMVAQKVIDNPFAEPNKTYVINKTVDLKGLIVRIPSGCSLIFKEKGRIQNGTLEGNNTKVAAGKHLIFNHVVLKGTFSAEKAYSDWFDITDDCVLDDKEQFVSGTNNLQGFKNLFLFNNVSITSGYYLVEGMLSCRSRQVINGNDAILKFMTKGVCINIDRTDRIPMNDVVIKNLSIVGCKQEYDDKTEYWHGVYVGYARNICIENVTCDQCRGDGFYVGTRITKERNERIPENITFNRVKALHSHRNGLSITRVVNATVSNSEFCFSSGTLPETGLDIEPNTVKITPDSLIVGEVENVTISKCNFHGNNKEGLIIANQNSTKPSIRIIKNIQVYNCSFDDDDITVSGCADSKLDNLRIKNSIVKVNGESIIRNLTLTKFNMVETEQGNLKNAIDLVYYKHWPVRSNIVISDMTIVGYGGVAINIGQGYPLLEKKFDGLIISGCRISHCGKGIEVGYSTKDLELQDNKVDGKSVSSTNAAKMGFSLLSFLLLAGGAIYLTRRKL